ncbi:MAG TPA: FkbM family methyltransferase [Xanthobacteraceae bacterium]|nr:FkbM family methyltransferase [Xanthobacteraceae bacterium]
MLKLLLPILQPFFRRKPFEFLHCLARGRFEIGSVIHVGAHLGQERVRYRELGAREVLWIEGSPSIFAQLQASLDAERATGKLYGRHVAINALLTDRAGESVELHGTSNAGASGSIFRMGDVHREKWPHVEHTGESETVISATLDEIAAREGFAMPDLLTVDVQGAELLVLRGGKKVLAEAKAVITEASTEKFYEGGVLFGELNAFLREQGFMAMQRPRKHGDILFLRKSLL